ncbi:hypothetical protein [Telmatospirillum sp. J64-1]|uniref:hypothetical protein n=1 Tax=Telmatospirillum sp. J64-1 TaxID=2502183 RepID=UPI00115CC760|nr:hypothetical protein [Telmatospirillum sp. J64-1]
MKTRKFATAAAALLIAAGLGSAAIAQQPAPAPDAPAAEQQQKQPGERMKKMHRQGHHHGMHGMPGMFGAARNIDKQLTAEEVEAILRGRLAFMANRNLTVGQVSEKDEKTVTATIVTKDGSLVSTLEFDRRTGFSRPVNG